MKSYSQEKHIVKCNRSSLFEELYSDLAGLKQFIPAMSGLSIGNFITFGTYFYFSGYKTLCNIDIDKKNKMNVFGLTISPNRLIEFRDAFDFTEADLKKVTIMPLADPYSAAITVK